jgi:hypothetical protein
MNARRELESALACAVSPGGARRLCTRRLMAAVALGPILLASAAAKAQDEIPAWAKVVVKDPNSPEMKAYAAQQKKRLAVERELKKFRSDFFRTARPPEVRAKAIEKLKEYTDPAIFPSLVDIFSTEAMDVRLGLLDHFAAQRTDEGDTTLAWIGVFDKSMDVREAAVRRLKERMTGRQSIPNQVLWVVYEGLAHGDEDAIAASAAIVNALSILEAIPMLINAQAGVSGGGGNSAGERTGALAYIFVGTQTTYVSDLTPVVSEAAVGFDPTVDVVNDGVVLEVLDAHVYVLRGPVRYALREIVTRETGLSTSHLGWNPHPWHEWYAKEFLPTLEKKRAEKAAQDAKEPGNSGVPKQPTPKSPALK